MNSRVLSGQGLSGHSDSRRTIVDILFLPDVPLRYSCMIVKEADPVGNHYHDCLEVFILDQGLIRVLVLQDVATGERQEFKDLGPGTQIHVPPGTAHALIMEPGSVLQMYVFSARPVSDREFFKPWPLIAS